MEDSINDLPGGFGLKRHYSILVDRYLNRHPDSSEYEMVKNEVEVYESFVEEVRTSIEKKEVIEGVNGKFSYDVDYLKSIEKYLEFFKDKLRILELEQKFENKSPKKNKSIPLPHQVALLNELGYFNLESFKSLPKEKMFEITAKLLNTDIRSVKGNYSTLNPRSNEDPKKYTAYNYMDAVKKYLNNV